MKAHDALRVVGIEPDDAWLDRFLADLDALDGGKPDDVPDDALLAAMDRYEVTPQGLCAMEQHLGEAAPVLPEPPLSPYDWANDPPVARAMRMASCLRVAWWAAWAVAFGYVLRGL